MEAGEGGGGAPAPPEFISRIIWFTRSTSPPPSPGAIDSISESGVLILVPQKLLPQLLTQLMGETAR